MITVPITGRLPQLAMSAFSKGYTQATVLGHGGHKFELSITDVMPDGLVTQDQERLSFTAFEGIVAIEFRRP
jgi:hypothetical protein